MDVFLALADHFGASDVDAVWHYLVARCSGAHITHHDVQAAFALLDDRDWVAALFTRWVIDPDEPVIRGTCTRP